MDCNGAKSKSPVTMTTTLHGVHEEHVLHSHIFPIFQTSTYLFDDVQHGADLFAGKRDGHIYTRLGNPTVQEFEKLISKLEGGVAGCAFGSGMGAISTCIWANIKAGEHILWGDTLYGCTVSFLEHIPKYGVESTPVDSSNLEAVKQAIRPNTKIIYLETPANPTNKITDIVGVCKLAKEKNILVIVDSTFSTPVFLRPLELGADIAVHSVTKYINGHGDVVGGCASFKSKEVADRVFEWRKDNGALMSPFEAFLVMRGLRTLPLRMERIAFNAITLAKHLEKHPKIDKVLHPGLESFPGHEIAMQQMNGFGGTFSILMAGGFDAAKTLCANLHIHTLAVSLGTLDSLIEHPASMTHACVPPEVMAKAGLTANLVRISVGLEDVNDLIKDIEQALEKC